MSSLVIACSTITDGSMKVSQSSDPRDIMINQQQFLARHDISINQTVRVPLTYGGDNYRRYFVVSEADKGEGMTRLASREADGLLTTTKGLALFLPLADCIGTVLYDSRQECLMLTHLGRHNLEQRGGEASVQYMVDQCSSNPADIQVWLSPAASGENYPLFSFDNRSMHDVAIEQLQHAGVLAQHITASPIDTTTDEHYYSHSQFLKGLEDTDGRFAVVAMMS